MLLAQSWRCFCAEAKEGEGNAFAITSARAVCISMARQGMAMLPKPLTAACAVCRIIAQLPECTETKGTRRLQRSIRQCGVAITSCLTS